MAGMARKLWNRREVGVLRRQIKSPDRSDGHSSATRWLCAAIGALSLLLSVIAFKGYLLDIGDAENEKFGYGLLGTSAFAWIFACIGFIGRRRKRRA
jgi:hypothetical protein